MPNYVSRLPGMKGQATLSFIWMDSIRPINLLDSLSCKDAGGEE